MFLCQIELTIKCVFQRFLLNFQRLTSTTTLPTLTTTETWTTTSAPTSILQPFPITTTTETLRTRSPTSKVPIFTTTSSPTSTVLTPTSLPQSTLHPDPDFTLRPGVNAIKLKFIFYLMVVLFLKMKILIRSL